MASKRASAVVNYQQHPYWARYGRYVYFCQLSYLEQVYPLPILTQLLLCWLSSHHIWLVFSWLSSSNVLRYTWLPTSYQSDYNSTWHIDINTARIYHTIELYKLFFCSTLYTFNTVSFNRYYRANQQSQQYDWYKCNAEWAQSYKFRFTITRYTVSRLHYFYCIQGI
jgi:hypothetical protein